MQQNKLPFCDATILSWLEYNGYEPSTANKYKNVIEKVSEYMPSSVYRI